MITLPPVYTRHNKPDTRSELHKALDKVDGRARELGVCPFGCEADKNDKLGYCEHLIGFTNANLKDGKLLADPDCEEQVELLSTERDATQRRVVTGKKTPLKAGDVLVRITCTRRVYRLKDEPQSKDAPRTAKTAVPVG